MQITPEDLRHHYASLSDEFLLEVEESDLTELGRKYYEAELAHRNLRRGGAPESAAAHEFDADAENAVEIGPDWKENAACPASFTAVPGSAHAPEAEHACDVLIAVGIPCQLSLVPHDPTGNDPDRGSFDVYQVLVPQSLNLKAVSVLDVEIFNPQTEAEWRAHLACLSDDELRELKPEIICAGMLDRAERLKRAYIDEIARRSTDGRSSNAHLEFAADEHP
jgi:hypothetical protein